jgi:hypothetical protein
MKENNPKNLLSKKLIELDLKLDIKHMTAEFEYHKSRSNVFQQAIRAQQIELDALLDTKISNEPHGDYYQ